MKGSIQRGPFVPLIKPPTHTQHTHTQSLSLREITEKDVRGSLLTSRCLATSQHARLWQAEVSAQNGGALWGIACVQRLSSPTIPFAVAATVKIVRMFENVFAADPGTVLQHQRLRKKGWEADFSSSRHDYNHVRLCSIWCIFWYVINSHFKIWYTVYFAVHIWGIHF